MARGRAALLRLIQKLGEEGPGQDLQASYLSMKIGGMFQEVIAMFVPVLNQSSSAPFQAIIGTTSDILLAAKPGSHFSLSGWHVSFFLVKS
ncbi:hypothetical protein DAI22_01g322300 [Oryza sativa Japonica Group]|nr:hypothetical protein DAI22_01g322300 [Oryza sativa Japonica Group]